MSATPPEGISEDDYEAIEAAVMETVRGRWFLAEYARRSRAGEMHQLLDAVSRLEQVVTEQKAEQKAMPADPAVRLLVQRLKDVSQQLISIGAEARLLGTDPDLCGRIEAQARALGGLIRLNGQPQAAGPQHAAPRALALSPAIPSAAMMPPPMTSPPATSVTMAPPSAPLPIAQSAAVVQPAAFAPPRSQEFAAPRPVPATADDQSREEIRLTALARLDCLPLAEKLALFA